MNESTKESIEPAVSLATMNSAELDNVYRERRTQLVETLKEANLAKHEIVLANRADRMGADAHQVLSIASKRARDEMDALLTLWEAGALKDVTATFEKWQMTGKM